MKQIKEFPNYSITENGIVINNITGKVKSVQTNYKNGYKSTILYKKNVNKRLYIHRLVAITYLPNIENKKEVNHIDGNKSNNSITNLEWVSPKENSIHGTRFRKQHYLSKIVLNIKTGVFYESIKEASDYHYLKYGTLKLHLRLNKKCDFIYV